MPLHCAAPKSPPGAGGAPMDEDGTGAGTGPAAAPVPADTTAAPVAVAAGDDGGENEMKEGEEEGGDADAVMDDHAKERELIKSHHYNLRKRLRCGRSVEEVWRENLEDREGLESYARAMKSLGDEWNTKRGGVPERIDWIVKMILDYYTLSTGDHAVGAKRVKHSERRVTGMVRHLAKAKKREYFVANNAQMPEEELVELERELSERWDRGADRQLDVIDVGSCYNPMADHDQASICDILPVDLCPAPDSNVYTCDFTSVKFETLEKKAVIVPSPGAPTEAVTKLRLNGFDVVVFCLLLSYMPCPQMRFKCLQNAFCALRPHGLLIIITPRTVGKKDLAWLKAWNRSLAALNFTRIAQDIKQKIVCLAYKKDSTERLPPDTPTELSFIPIGADDTSNPKLFAAAGKS